LIYNFLLSSERFLNFISFSLDLAEKLEPSGRSGGRSPYSESYYAGWIWCSGTSVKAVDFIHYDEKNNVVSIVLNISFNIQPENLERIKEEHRFSMAAENIVGDLAEKLEP